jgi:hypothetical protein
MDADRQDHDNWQSMSTLEKVGEITLMTLYGTLTAFVGLLQVMAHG